MTNPPSDPSATPPNAAQRANPGKDLRVSDLNTRRPTPFDITPDADARAVIGQEMGLLGLRKLRFQGQVCAQGVSGWELTGMLGATLVQECGITLEPVTTRVDEPVTRRYLPDLPDPALETTEIEIEMPEDDSLEPLGAYISPWSVMLEALSLAIPAFPRADGATTGEAVYTEPGAKPMRDADAKPFAGLAALRAQMDKDPD